MFACKLLRHKRYVCSRYVTALPLLIQSTKLWQKKQNLRWTPTLNRFACSLKSRISPVPFAYNFGCHPCRKLAHTYGSNAQRSHVFYNVCQCLTCFVLHRNCAEEKVWSLIHRVISAPLCVHGCVCSRAHRCKNTRHDNINMCRANAGSNTKQRLWAHCLKYRMR